MSSAVDFPNLSLSPIRGESETTHFVKSSSPSELEPFRVRSDGSSGRSVVPDSCSSSRQPRQSTAEEYNGSSDMFDNGSRRVYPRVPSPILEDREPSSRENTSSDRAFDELERDLMRTLRVTRNDEEEEGLTIERLIERRENKRDHPSTSNSLFSLYNSAEDSPRATIFAGLRMIVLMGDCSCRDSAVICLLIEEMGGRILSGSFLTLTHIVLSDGGDLAILRKIIADFEASNSTRPHLVPPQWIHECYEEGRRLPETAFSLYNDQYVQSVERRASGLHQRPSRQESLHEGQFSHESSHEAQSSHEIPHQGPSRSETSHETSYQSDRVISDSLLTKDLTFDRPMKVTQLIRKVQILTKRLDKCAESMGHDIRCPSRALARQTREPFRPVFKALDLRPRRRRSHGGFCYEHRDSDEEIVMIREDNRDKLEWIGQATAAINANREGSKAPERTVRGVDDMRRTVEMDLNRMRHDCKVKLENMFETLQNNAFYRARGGGFGTQRGRTSQRNMSILRDSQPRVVSTASRPNRFSIVPVQTKSAFINGLQCVDSNQEFLPRVAARRRRRAIVITGFRSREKIPLKEAADSLQIRIEHEVDDTLRCVVSSTGGRTLNVLMAIVHGVPIVSKDWLLCSQRANRLQSIPRFEYPQWASVAKVRATAPHGVFSSAGKIRVLEGCTPPSKVMKQLIKKSGGWLTSDTLEASLIVAPDGVFRMRSRDMQNIVSEKYIFDCITCNSLLSVDPEPLEEEDERSEPREISSFSVEEGFPDEEEIELGEISRFSEN